MLGREVDLLLKDPPKNEFLDPFTIEKQVKQDKSKVLSKPAFY